ncbi:MAG: AAA family ATPase [Solirubrobacterales bacterium]
MRSSGRSFVAISGPVCAGKSTLAAGLRSVMGARILTTRLLIADHLGRDPNELTRGELQRAGEELDEERGGAWVAEGVADLSEGKSSLVVIDAVRNAEQLAALQAKGRTLHVHLTADPDVLAARYEERRLANPQLEFTGFEDLRVNPTEAKIGGLSDLADLGIDTSRAGAEATVREVTKLLDQRVEPPD